MKKLANINQIERLESQASDSADPGCIEGTCYSHIGKGSVRKLYSRIVAASIVALALMLSISTLHANLAPMFTPEPAYAAVQLKAGSTSKNTTATSSGTKLGAAATESYVNYSSGTYMLTCRSGGKCVDIPAANTGNNVAVKTWTNNGTMAQRFYVEKQSNGTYTIKAGCSGKYLADRSGTLVQQTKSNSNYQRWQFVKNGSYVLLRNVATGRCVTVGSTGNSASLTTKTKSGNTNQQFSMASAQLIKNGYYVLCSTTGGRCLDVDSAKQTNNANVQIWHNNGTNAQKWYISHTGGGYYKLVNAASGKALDQYSYSKNNGNNVVQYTSGNITTQYWYASVSDSGGVVFVNKYSGNALDVSSCINRDGQNVHVWNRNDTAAQRWTPIATTKINPSVRTVNVGVSVTETTDYNGLKTVSIPSGTYTMRSLLGRMLDVSGASLDMGGNIQIWANNGTDAQKWNITSVGSGYYTISSANSGLAMDVMNGWVANGTNVRQWHVNNSAAQRWKAEIYGNSLVFVSECSGRVLDVSGGVNRDGQNVQIWDRNNTNAQRWTLAKTSLSYDNLLARQIFDAYNNYRASKGLRTVAWDENCANIARQSSRNCASLGRLQHETAIPSNQSLSDILQYSSWKKTASEVVNRWVNSTGHRRMMQCATATKAGVGVYRASNGYYYYTIVYDFSGTNQSGS